MPKSGLDWIALGLLLFIGGGLFAGFFFYLRTSYKSSGWRRVGRDFLIAIIAIVLAAIWRHLKEGQLKSLEDIVDRLTKP